MAWHDWLGLALIMICGGAVICVGIAAFVFFISVLGRAWRGP